MPDLPTPRDERERENAKAYWKAGWRTDTDGGPVRPSLLANLFSEGNAERFAEAAIPPVGEEKMPELAKPFAVIQNGHIRDFNFSAMQRAVECASLSPDSIAVRLIIAEVYDPPAPDSWEKLAESYYQLSRGGDVPFTYIDLEARRAALLAGKGEGA